LKLLIKNKITRLQAEFQEEIAKKETRTHNMDKLRRIKAAKVELAKKLTRLDVGSFKKRKRTKRKNKNKKKGKSKNKSK
jgi:hypothetical protein